jgi:hypothetical protein
MATTTNYSWTTPDDTALVKDGAAAIRSLGTAIDSTVFTNAGNAIAKTIVDAKGDIIVGTAADTVARLASSATNGDLLTVDTSTATGLKWATPASSSPASAAARVETEQSTTSSSFTDLTTAGPEVTLTTGTKVLVIITAEMLNSSGTESSLASFAVSGASTIPAGTYDWYVRSFVGTANERVRFSAASRFAGYTAGSNTFTMKYRRTGGTASFGQREIIVMDLGS